MRKSFPFYLNILTVFSILVVTIVTGVILYGYRSNTAVSLVSARQLVNRVGLSVAERSRVMFDTAFNTADIFIDFPDISQKASLHSHPMSHVFFRFLEQHQNFTSLYMGFDDGDFFLVSSLSGRETMKKRLNIPYKAAWYTQVIGHLKDGTRYELKKYLDDGFVTVGSACSRQVTYDPRERGWYRDANTTPGSTLSEVYTFSLSDEPGITVSRRFEGKVHGVFGVDMSLANLSGFVRRQAVGDRSEIMIFGREGNVYAYPDLRKLVAGINSKEGPSSDDSVVQRLGVPVLSLLLKNLQAGIGEAVEVSELTASGKAYLVQINPLPDEYGKKLYVAVAVPEGEFTGPIAVIGKQTMLVSLIMVLLSLPIIYGVAKLISRPLIVLKKAVEKIKTFNLDIPIANKTLILEIRDLTAALETMRGTLKAFGSYVPTPLVKRMITHNIIPSLGGDRRELTFMFTDIEGFTEISESMSPEVLTGSITEYFKKVSRTILWTNGTVDKYIGDAVMAFWNAPVLVPSHAHDACLAALRCRAALRVFNRKNRERGKPEFLTRIGIHTGEAVVGNIGSTDRMAYTAMGAPVNLTSRLEGLNKYLGTGILVSGVTSRAAGDVFVFRFAGRVIPKGTTQGLRVYELMGTRPDSTGVYAPLAVSPEIMVQVTEWEAAYELLLSSNFTGAAKALANYLEKNGPDKLVEHYLASAEAFMVNPPPDDWNGEQVFDVK